MPLSEHEQRMLKEIESALYADDPKFASSVRKTGASGARRPAGLVVALAALGVALLIGGLALDVSEATDVDDLRARLPDERLQHRRARRARRLAVVVAAPHLTLGAEHERAAVMARVPVLLTSGLDDGPCGHLRRFVVTRPHRRQFTQEPRVLHLDLGDGRACEGGEPRRRHVRRRYRAR